MLVDVIEIESSVGGELAASARAFARAATSEATRRAYRCQWGAFERWCGARGLLALPTSPATVALYLAELAEAGRKVASVELALAAIAAAHGAAGFASPRADARVRMVVRGIRRTKGMAQRQAAPLLAADVRAVTSRLPATTVQGTRDRVLVLLGWAGAFRRSELVGFDVGDVRFVDQGLEVMVRRSKVDQEARGRVVAVPYAGDPSVCPVRAVRRWLEVASLDAGPLLRAVDRHGRVGKGRLDGGSVARVLKRLAQATGLDAGAVAGHSLRAGFATTAARRGRSERAIAEVTGHRGVAMLRKYIRAAERWTEPAGAGLLDP